LFFACLAACAIITAISPGFEIMAQEKSATPRRDINDALRAHDKELLAIPGVVGVYVAVLEDGKTPCLKVMLAQKSAETERAIPKTLEGYPVVVEVTGEIRPLGN
jgi:molybdopterin/thiamine biosynthesis adenylyltransferase